MRAVLNVIGRADEDGVFRLRYNLMRSFCNEGYRPMEWLRPLDMPATLNEDVSGSCVQGSFCGTLLIGLTNPGVRIWNFTLSACASDLQVRELRADFLPDAPENQGFSELEIAIRWSDGTSEKLARSSHAA